MKQFTAHRDSKPFWFDRFCFTDLYSDTRKGVPNVADTRVLRQKLQDQLQQIQEKLRALDIVDAMSAELGVNGTQGALPPSLLLPSGKTIQKTCRELALKDPTKHWTVATMTPEVQRNGRPDANRANVTTALRRLARKGVLELVSRNKRTGHVYRAARIAKAAS